MAKQFAMVVGWVLIVVGVLNFFVEPIMVMPVHALFHIVAGAPRLQSLNPKAFQ